MAEKKVGVRLDVLGMSEAVAKLNTFGKAIRQNTSKMGKEMDKNLSVFETSFENTGKNAKDLSSEFKNLSVATKKPTFQALENSIENTGKQASTLNGEFEDFSRNMGIQTRRTRVFKMELLGVMFFGMMVQQTFMGMLQPAAEAFGIFDIWKDMLLVVFIPVMETILPLVLAFTDFFMNLPTPVQNAIGVLTVLGVVLGGLLFYVGAVGLGLSSIIQWMLPFASASIASASSLVVFKGILAAIIQPILLVSGIIALLWLAWKYNFGNIREYTASVFNAIKGILSGFVDVFKGLWGLLQGIIELDGKKVWDGIKLIGEGFGKIFIKGVGGIAKSLSKFLWDSIGDIASWVLELNKKIFDLLTKIPLIGGAIGAVGGAFGAVGERVLGSRQFGGYIPETGLYNLHAGETVTPAGTSISGVTINVNVSGNGMSNDRELAEKIGEVVTAQLRNVTIR